MFRVIEFNHKISMAVAAWLWPLNPWPWIFRQYHSGDTTVQKWAHRLTRTCTDAHLEFVTPAKKCANFNEFSEIKKFVKCPRKRKKHWRLNTEVILNWTIHFKLNIKQTYKGGLYFTVICCTNKCIINERYIPEHQNKLTSMICKITNFYRIFFNRKKIREIR